MAVRRSFSTDFKLEAAQLVLDGNYTVPKACEALGIGHWALGIGPTALRLWVKLQQERGGATPHTAKALTPEQQQIQALQAKVRRLELEKEILKNRLPGAPRPTGLENPGRFTERLGGVLSIR